MGDETGTCTKNIIITQEGQNQDELILQQQRQIEKEVFPTQPLSRIDLIAFSFQISDSINLVGNQESLSSLKDEYLNDDVYQMKVKDLLTKYKFIRRTRPDGNCFFRAFCYAYLERLVLNKDEYKIFIERVQKNQNELIKMGFPQFTVEDFYDTVSLRNQICIA